MPLLGRRFRVGQLRAHGLACAPMASPSVSWWTNDIEAHISPSKSAGAPDVPAVPPHYFDAEPNPIARSAVPCRATARPWPCMCIEKQCCRLGLATDATAWMRQSSGRLGDGCDWEQSHPLPERHASSTLSALIMALMEQVNVYTRLKCAEQTDSQHGGRGRDATWHLARTNRLFGWLLFVQLVSLA